MYRTLPDVPGPGWQSEGVAFYVSPVQVPNTVPLYQVYKEKAGNLWFADHFYTTDLSARNNCIVSLGYADEGILGYVMPAGTSSNGSIPLYRTVRVHKDSYGQVIQDHFYQTDPATPANYAFERIECQVWSGVATLPEPAGGLKAVPVYRFYYDAMWLHAYRTLNDVPGPGWAAEGVSFYVSPIEVSNTVPFYEVYNPKTGDHFYTTDFAGRNHLIASQGFIDKGVLGYVVPADKEVPGTVPLYRWVRTGSTTNQDHFYQTGTTPPAKYLAEGVAARVWDKPVLLRPLVIIKRGFLPKGMSY